MTDEFKEKTLKYLTGNLVSEIKSNKSQVFNEQTKVPEFWDSEPILNKREDMFVFYANNIITLTDLNFKVIATIDKYSTGTNIETIEYLNYDENGYFYGIDIKGTDKRFVLFNDFTVPDINRRI